MSFLFLRGEGEEAAEVVPGAPPADARGARAEGDGQGLRGGQHDHDGRRGRPATRAVVKFECDAHTRRLHERTWASRLAECHGPGSR